MYCQKITTKLKLQYSHLDSIMWYQGKISGKVVIFVSTTVPAGIFLVLPIPSFGFSTVSIVLWRFCAMKKVTCGS